jgi:hypothetical protein
MKQSKRAKIASQVFTPSRATRKLADEPLTPDDWRKIYEAQQNFIAAVRRVVFEARCREAGVEP